MVYLKRKWHPLFSTDAAYNQHPPIFSIIACNIHWIPLISIKLYTGFFLDSEALNAKSVQDFRLFSQIHPFGNHHFTAAKSNYIKKCVLQNFGFTRNLVSKECSLKMHFWSSKCKPGLAQIFNILYFYFIKKSIKCKHFVFLTH